MLLSFRFGHRLVCIDRLTPPCSAWKGGFIRDAAAEGPDLFVLALPQRTALTLTAYNAGIALVFPDTSPRGASVEGEDKDWDFGTDGGPADPPAMTLLTVFGPPWTGTGAGFYVNATKEPWNKHYNMCAVTPD